MACHGVFCKLYDSLMIFHCLTPQPSGKLWSYIEWTYDYDIIYRTLHGKPILVNYPFCPIDSFWFLNSNLQCQNSLFFPVPLHWYFRISTKHNQLLWQIQGQIQLVQLFWETLYLGISCILVTCLLNNVILTLCALGCDGHWRLTEIICFVFLFRCLRNQY